MTGQQRLTTHFGSSWKCSFFFNLSFSLNSSIPWKDRCIQLKLFGLNFPYSGFNSQLKGKEVNPLYHAVIWEQGQRKKYFVAGRNLEPLAEVMSSFSGEDRVALWDKEGSQTQLTGVCKMFTAAASPPVSPLSIPHHAIPQQCPSEEDTPPSAPPCSTTSLWPPATAPSLPEANPTRAWPSTSVKQW